MGDKKRVAFSVNGEKKTFKIPADRLLLDLLRDEGYTGVKNGCGDGSCGSCTIIMDGLAVNACTTFAFQAQDRDVWTVEGIGDFDAPHPFQQALVDSGGAQCGFCIPGIVMAVKAMLDENPKPSEEEIKVFMDGNICRCTGYEKIEDAIRAVITGA